MRLLFDKQNPNSTTFASILAILAVVNDAFMEFGAMFGISDRTISMIAGGFLVLTYIYNRLRDGGIISESPLKTLSRHIGIRPKNPPKNN